MRARGTVLLAGVLSAVLWGWGGAGAEVGQGAARERMFSITPENIGAVRIVLPRKADDMKIFAAQELQEHLQRVLGVRIPVVRNGRVRDHALMVGIQPEADPRPLKTEEGRYLVTPDAVYLYGDDRVRSPGDDPLHSSIGYDSYFNLGGTQFAVYDFLEREVGIRWLEPGPDGVVYTPRNRLDIGVGRHSWVSPLGFDRGMRSGTWRNATAHEGFIPADFVLTPEQAAHRREELDLWLRRMRMGAKEHLHFGHAFTDWWEKYGKDHPEYFALNGRGVRGPMTPSEPDRVKICPSQPGVVRQVIANWLERRRAHPLDAREVCVAQNDAGGAGADEYCHCAQCRALDVQLPGEPFGRHLTDRYLYLANRTLAVARAHVPDAIVTAYAYSVTLQPPRRERVADGVVLDFVTGMDAPLAQTREIYEKWKEAGLGRFGFRPNDLWAELGLPLGQDERWFRHQQLALEEGADGVDHDSVEGFWTGVSGLGYYALAKGMVDPGKDFAYWEAEYTAAFGAAGPQVREYFRYWRRKFDQVILPADQQARKTSGEGFLHWHGLGAVAGKIRAFYSLHDFAVADSLLQAGWRQELTPLQRHQLRRLILANQHSRLTFQAMAAVQDGDDARILARARELVDFRRAERDSLRMNWWMLFSEQNQMGDVTGVTLLINQKRLAGRPRSFFCPRVAHAPRIDGCLDEPAWGEARTGVEFLLNRSARTPQAATRALLVHDADNLYLGVECQEPHMNRVLENETQRDGTVWKDNAVELFVDPDNTGDHLCQFIVSSAGVLFDGRMQDGAFTSDWNLEVGAQVQYAVGKTDTSWVLEMRLPFESLGMESPRPGTSIRFNVNRDRNLEGESGEQASLSPTFGLFHMPRRFASLRF